MATNGIGACILGYGDPDVDEAVKKAVDSGSMSTLNAPEEVELAEILCELHSWANMVRYTRAGGESLTVAVRIARSHTKRDKVVFCGYHGWHDWYLSANLADDHHLDGHLLPGLAPAGVPRALNGTAIPFAYNNLDDLNRVMKEHQGDVAAIVMEPVRSTEPEDGFLQKVREVAGLYGCVLIFDEVTSGFRMTSGGAHLLYGVNPDMAVFAKAMSNGYPMGAVIGRAPVMEAAQDCFISSTYWTERIGPTAAIATIKKHKQFKVHEHLMKIGRMVKQGLLALAENHCLQLSVKGIDPLIVLNFDYEEDSQLLATLFTQEMLKKGFLAGKAFYATFAHQEDIVCKYLEEADEVFGRMSEAITKDRVASLLNGPVAHAGFSRLT